MREEQPMPDMTATCSGGSFQFSERALKGEQDGVVAATRTPDRLDRGLVVGGFELPLGRRHDVHACAPFRI
jgi:hypothetical protein